MKILLGLFTLLLLFGSLTFAVEQSRYYAHEKQLDRYGVIAPWYQGQNGQFDLRVRIAAETLKRYPWTDATYAVPPAPHWVYSGHWNISEEGTITAPLFGKWDNGDLGQRAAYILSGYVDYYRYTGDAAALAGMSLMADALLDWELTPDDHPWPRFLVSVPKEGEAYGKANPKGFIQLDIVAEVGLGLVRAYEVVGNERWLEAAQHWADLLAAHQDLRPGMPPFGRYANPEDAPWPDIQTGGIAFILEFYDELLQRGYKGEKGALKQARTAGVAWLRDELLPRWLEDQTWGRNYWDWPDYVMAENVTEFVARYLMRHPEEFPDWQTQTRNVLSLFLNRTSVFEGSNGDVFSGAWAFPESSGCCGRSLWYGPMELSMVFSEYGVRATSEWGRELGRRMQLIATYDALPTGVVEDNIDGGFIVAGAWFKIAHPMALKHVLGTLAWAPELGAARENHIMNSTAVVREVTYDAGRIEYETFDAPKGTTETLRLAFCPTRLAAGGKALPLREKLEGKGYSVQALPGGDWLVTVRHDGQRKVVIEGPDPQQEAGLAAFNLEGNWEEGQTSEAGASATLTFTGNQVRLLADFGPMGGRADVYLDGQKQLVFVDCWSPVFRSGQVLYYQNGLPEGQHMLRLVARGEGNPRSGGARISLTGAQWSAEAGRPWTGAGGGPREAQRWIFGYPRDTDYVDAEGNSWRPATEWIIRLGFLKDAVKEAWWTDRRQHEVIGTDEDELYRYGAHGRDFTSYFTVAPGRYHVRLKFCETRWEMPAGDRVFDVFINGEEVISRLDVAATGGGLFRAVDLVFDDIPADHGVIAVRFTSQVSAEAMVQAIEIGPGAGGEGAAPVSASWPEVAEGNLLVNPGFESGAPQTLGKQGDKGSAAGWTYLFASASESYIWDEAGYDIHPDWGLPEFHSGAHGLRTHTQQDGHTLLWQDLRVKPSTTYRASAWVKGTDLHGKGFARTLGDEAALVLQEYCCQGKLLVDHPRQRLVAAGEWQQLSLIFTTTEQATQLRFLLDNRIAGPYNEGHITWDDCELVEVEPGG